MKKTTANINACAINSDSKIAIFVTLGSDTKDSNQLFIIDVEHKIIVNNFYCSSFKSAEIDTDNNLIKMKDHRGFIKEINFDNHQTNKVDYENQVLREGSVYDRLSLYECKLDEIKLKDKNYLHLLFQALNDNNASYSFGQDRLYRKIGEYYEVAGDTNNAIKNWEKALALNPKVGIKRKLKLLKEQIQK